MHVEHHELFLIGILVKTLKSVKSYLCMNEVGLGKYLSTFKAILTKIMSKKRREGVGHRRRQEKMSIS